MSTPYKNFFKNSKQNIETRIVLNENSKNYIHDLENPDFLSNSIQSKSQLSSHKLTYLQPEIKVVPKDKNYQIQFGDNEEQQEFYSANMSGYLNKFQKTTKFKYNKADSGISQNSKTIDKFLPNIPSNLSASSYLQTNINNLNKNLTKSYQKYIKESPLRQEPKELSFQVYRQLEKNSLKNSQQTLNYSGLQQISSKRNLTSSQNCSSFDIVASKKCLDDKYFYQTAQDLHYAETKLSRMLEHHQKKQFQLNKIETKIKDQVTNHAKQEEMDKVKFYSEIKEFQEKVVPQIHVQLFDNSALLRQQERLENFIQSKHWSKYQKSWAKSKLLTKTSQNPSEIKQHKVTSLSDRFNFISKPAIKSIINQVQARDDSYYYNNSLIKSFNINLK